MNTSQISLITVNMDYRGYPRVDVEHFKSYSHLYQLLLHRVQFFPQATNYDELVAEWEYTERMNEKYKTESQLDKKRRGILRQDSVSEPENERIGSADNPFKNAHFPLHPVNESTTYHKKIGEWEGVAYYRIHGLVVFYADPEDRRITYSKDGSTALYVSGVFSQKERDKLMEFQICSGFSIPEHLPYSPDLKTWKDLEREFNEELMREDVDFIEFPGGMHPLDMDFPDEGGSPYDEYMDGD
jgi:hypothetical protein